MARKQPEIKVVSYVHVGNELVNTDDLSPERKRELATWLTWVPYAQSRRVFLCRQ